MAGMEALRPRERLLVMDLVAEAGLDVSDWANYAGKHPAANPRYCYDWVFTQEGAPSVACLWFDNISLKSDGVALQRLNLWDVAKKHESLPGRSSVAKRARAMDLAMQTAFRKQTAIRVILVDGERADLVAQNAQSSKVERRLLDPVSWTVAEYNWSTGNCLLVRNEAVEAAIRQPRDADTTTAEPERLPPSGSPIYVARLVYNSDGWHRPMAAAEVQEAGETYRNENGFGHEDWLFRDEWVLEGWRYGFVQGVNNSRVKLLRDGTPFDLRLFTMPALGGRRAVAEIRGVECIDDQTAQAAVAAYQHRGWLDTMRAEITEAGGRPEALDETGHAPHIINLRYRIENRRMLDASKPLPADDPVQRLKRYGLYATPGAMHEAVGRTGERNGAPDALRLPLTAGDYRRAFLEIEMSESQRRWLVAHYYSPNVTTSMLQLANALGYEDHRAANGAYGALARMVADVLPRAPHDLGDEYGDWLQALGTLVERDALNHSQWRLREEVVQALVELGWVEAREATDEDAEPPTEEEQNTAREYGLDDTQIRQMMLSRRGQGRFRHDTLRFWGGRCAVSGLAESCFLVASHIKPWKEANPNERLDGFNGLALSPNLDKAFDRGYISFASDGSIMLSPTMSAESMHALGIRPDMALRLCHARIEPYLAYHRERVFIRDHSPAHQFKGRTERQRP